MSFFRKKPSADEPVSEIMKYTKNPELFKEFEQQRSDENKRYQDHKKKLKNI